MFKHRKERVLILNFRFKVGKGVTIINSIIDWSRSQRKLCWKTSNIKKILIFCSILQSTNFFYFPSYLERLILKLIWLYWELNKGVHPLDDKKWSFPLRISSLNMIKSAGNSRFGFKKSLMEKFIFCAVYHVFYLKPSKISIGTLRL